MGALSTAAKNLALNALVGTNPTTPITHAGLFNADAAVAPTGAQATDLFTLTAHGFSDGNVVVFTALTGGGGAFVVGRPYFVVTSAANTFQLAETSGGSPITFTVDVSGVSLRRLVELSGGSPAYARKAIAFNAAAGGSIDDSTAPVFDVPASADVDYAGYWSAVTAGTLLAIDDLTTETYAGQGTYTLSDTDIDLNG